MKLPEGKLDPQIIALDLDDTLLNHNLEITPKTAQALQKAAEKGIYITLCSGRAENAILPYIHQLNIAGMQAGRFIIAQNGSTVFDLHKRLSIYERTVEPDVLLTAYKAAERYNLVCQVYDSSTIYVAEDNKWARLDVKLSGLKMRVVKDFPLFITKKFPKMVIPGEPSVLQKLMKDLRKELGDRAVIFVSKPYFLEVMPAHTGKGEAVRWLADELEIPWDKTMAFGDSMNDESMIRLTHFSVAMLNGLPYLQEIAAYVTRKTNEEDGIGDFIETFVL